MKVIKKLIEMNSGLVVILGFLFDSYPAYNPDLIKNTILLSRF